MTTDTLPGTPSEAAVVTLRSTLRIGDIGEFKQECDTLLDAARNCDVSCDASAVEFIDAAALQYLVALAGLCREQTRGFAIRNASAAFSSAVAVSGYGVPLGLVAH
jgi:anti-anti-sigma regulatory factor